MSLRQIYPPLNFIRPQNCSHTRLKNFPENFHTASHIFQRPEHNPQKHSQTEPNRSIQSKLNYVQLIYQSQWPPHSSICDFMEFWQFLNVIVIFFTVFRSVLLRFKLNTPYTIGFMQLLVHANKYSAFCSKIFELFASSLSIKNLWKTNLMKCPALKII